ncbi:MAG TPA: TadE/TadG family type IV pilus assembly protein [Xanthobacteraceae bacterium]|nr:TadE/TadG family type IV pilus assembly protein [Xanthobacteraceae bacterium]
MRVFSGLMNRFCRDQRGNIAVIFAIACIPVLAAVGCGVDYSEASRMRAKLQSAADAAAVASISQNSQGWLAASQMTGNGTVTTAQTDAMNIFLGNINNVYNPGNPNANLFTLNTPPTAAVVTKTGANLTSTVTFNASVPTVFMNVLGFKSLTIQGSSSASASLPLYLDFYVALDVSGSMGLPSTPSEAQRMQWASPDNYIQYPTGCTLACHFSPQNSACIDPGKSGATQGYPTNGYCLGYMISRVSQSGYNNLLVSQSPSGTYPYKNLNQNFPATLGKSQQLPSSLVSGLPNSLYNKLPPVTSCPTAGTDACIQLRLDAVGVALNATQAANGVDGLFATAINPQYAQVPKQFRIGLYPFITKMDTNYAPLTYNINASPTTPGTINYAAVNLATELDTNTNSNLGSGGTHIDVGLNSLNNLITSVGTGTNSTDTLPYIFLITDGAQDPQSKGVPNGSWSGSNHAVTLGDSSNQYPTICSTIKKRGIVISILYIPYQKISPVNASFANDEDDYANNNINGPPGISTALTNCASPGFMYTANTPQDITTSLQAMFKHALMTAHLTN